MLKTNLGDELHVEWPCNLEMLADGSTDGSNFVECLLVEILRRRDESSVAGVNPSVLYVFTHGDTQQLTVQRYSVHVYFL